MKKNNYRYLLMALILTSFISIYSCTKEDEKVYPTPATPLNILPAINDTGISLLPTLTWTACSYPDNSMVSYDVYIGTDYPPELGVTNIKLTNYTLQYPLLPFKKYYWKVVSKDEKNNETSSSIWNFTTGYSTGSAPGDLAIVVKDTFLNAYGGAAVYVYLTEAERTNDFQRKKYWRKGTTDNPHPDDGAIFYALPDQMYYVFCMRDMGLGKMKSGIGESRVPLNKKTKLVVIVK